MDNTIRVWDPLVRIFHWSLVLTFCISYFSGEGENDLHIYTGYAVLGLVMFRVLWGFAGSRYARFSDFVYSPRTTIQYLKDLLAKKPKHYVGHNPAGGWMVIVMIFCLFVTTVSGLKVYAIEEGLGPLAGESPDLSIRFIANARADSDDDEHDSNNEYTENGEAEEFWEEIHEISSNFMLLLIFLHIAGVIVSARIHNEHLVKAMITGTKTGKTDIDG